MKCFNPKGDLEENGEIVTVRHEENWHLV